MFDFRVFIRKEKISINDIAEKTGYSYAYISRMLNGKDPMNYNFLKKLRAGFYFFMIYRFGGNYIPVGTNNLKI